MATKKLACEEAADMIGRIWSKESTLIKPLQAEGRELKRLRKWNHDRYYGTLDQQLAATVGLQRMADSIQKARKAK